MTDEPVKELNKKPDDELIELINVNTTHGEKIQAILASRTANRLIESLNNNAESSNKLSNKIFWLNVALTAATVVYTIATVVGVTKSPN